LTNEVSIYNTTMAHFLLFYSPINQLTGSKICEKDLNSQLCLEHELL